jgi:hypothetical protein
MKISMNFRTRIVFYIVLITLVFGGINGFVRTSAQGDPVPTPTQVFPIFVTRTEPPYVTAGTEGTLTVLGGNFSSSTSVRLVGIGILSTTLVSSTALTAAVPNNLPVGQYTIEVSDPFGGTVPSPNSLVVIPAVPTATPTFTPSPQPTSTIPPTATLQPTPMPGQPALVVRSFSASPEKVAPGQPVTLTFEVVNQGNREARGAFVTLDAGKFLPANGQAGATLPDLAPGAVQQVTLNAVAAADAPEGVNSIPLTFTYSDFEKAYSNKAALSVSVEKPQTGSPSMLLASYDSEKETLTPGDMFTLTMNLRNVGDAAASDLMVTFGTVTSTGGSSDDDGGTDGGSDGGSDGGGSSSTTPSETFAILGAGDTQYIGSVPNGENNAITIKQQFIINGTAKSGIYNVPVTLRYKTPDGDDVQNTLRVSVVVVAPPRMQVRLPAPLPEMVMAGEGVPFAVEIRNTGESRINLLNATVSAENGDVPDGRDTFLGPLPADDDTTVAAMVVPMGEGEMTITFTLNYLDDLNRPQTMTQTYTVQVSAPPPPPEETPPPAEPTPEAPTTGSILSRVLMGLLGLGS